jgi:pimeloyl-ACP methyl ester carboxylesterase
MRHLAIRRHNAAVAELLRRAGSSPDAGGEHWTAALAPAGVDVSASSPSLGSVPIHELWVAGDFRVKNLEPVAWDGLGVPAIAVSHFHDRSSKPGKFYPERLQQPATAVAGVTGPLERGAWRAGPLRVMLHDPRVECTTEPIGTEIESRLAGDLTTPLATQFLLTPLRRFSLGGVLRPDEYSVTPAILMQQPHQPGKIPVLFVHGLASNPEAWLRMVNRLQADPSIRDRYEFCYAYYPSGATLMMSASRIRHEIRALRDAIDPGHADPALDRMVVVGHSLGGVLARQLVQASDRELERGLFTGPFDQVRMSDVTRRQLADLLYFEPEPSIRRVVFIAAPHRGSNTANRLIGRLSSALVNRPARIEKMHAEIIRSNGADVFTPAFRRRAPSSIDNLEWNSPILRILSELPVADGVTYHSIIAAIVPAAPVLDRRRGELRERAQSWRGV